MLKLSEFAEAIGATRVDLQNWHARLELRTTYAETIAGSARRFSLENVLELALINAYVRAGFPPQTAVAAGDATVRAHKAGAPIREWSIIAAGDFANGRMSDSLDKTQFDKLTRSGTQAPVFSIVRIGEIVRRVERLFSGEGGGAA